MVNIFLCYACNVHTPSFISQGRRQNHVLGLRNQLQVLKSPQDSSEAHFLLSSPDHYGRKTQEKAFLDLAANMMICIKHHVVFMVYWEVQPKQQQSLAEYAESSSGVSVKE